MSQSTIFQRTSAYDLHMFLLGLLPTNYSYDWYEPLLCAIWAKGKPYLREKFYILVPLSPFRSRPAGEWRTMAWPTVNDVQHFCQQHFFFRFFIPPLINLIYVLILNSVRKLWESPGSAMFREAVGPTVVLTFTRGYKMLVLWYGYNVIRSLCWAPAGNSSGLCGYPPAAECVWNF